MIKVFNFLLLIYDKILAQTQESDSYTEWSIQLNINPSIIKIAILLIPIIIGLSIYLIKKKNNKTKN